MIIGIEVELHSDGLKWDQIMKKEKLSTTEFVYKDGLGIKMSKEFYPHTIEYNFAPKKLSKAYLEKIKYFLEDQVRKYNLKLSAECPAFVGTHVHIFDIKFRKLKNDELLKTAMEHVSKSFNSLEMNSRMRLSTSHHLWGNWVHRFFSDYFGYMEVKGFPMQFRGLCSSKEKYNPTLISNRSEKGKPRSVEIRIIPNEFMFDDRMFNMLDDIQKCRFKEVNIKDTLLQWLDKFSKARNR